MAIYARDGHENNFHIIRHLAAICVVLTHAYSITTGLYESEPLVTLTGRSIGHYAVDVFFLLSGFLVTQSLVRDRDLLKYGIARILRIFPGLLFATLLVALILGPIVSVNTAQSYYSDPLTWSYVLGAFSTLHIEGILPGVFAGHPVEGLVNAPLWTIKYELAAYAILGAIVALSVIGRKWLLMIVCAFLVLLYIVGRTAVPWPETESIIGSLLHLMPPFLIGSAAYLFRDKVPLGFLTTILLTALTFITSGTVFFEISEKLLMASVVFWIAFLPYAAGQSLQKSGDYSYGIYIFHYPIMQTIYLIYPEISAPTLFLTGLLATLPFAVFSWYVIERPSMRARDKLLPAVRSFGPISRLSTFRR